MRILFLTRTFPPDAGAVGNLVRELGEALLAKGHEVTVVAGGAAECKRGVGDTKVQVVRVGGLAFTRKSHFRRALSYLTLYPAMLWAALREGRPDVIVTTTDPPLQALLGVFLKVIFRCRLVHWSQDLYPEMAEEAGVLRKRGSFANLLRWVSTEALRRHDRVISIGRCMSARLRGRGLRPEQIVEVANWTNPDVIVPMDRARSRFADREDLQGLFVVMYSGNLGMAHTFNEMLDAAEMLQESAAEVVFVFVGEGPRRQEVEAAVEKRGLMNVRFYPSQPFAELSDSLAAGHLHVVSLRETMSGLVVPSKFYGIMAAGRPCLFIGPADSEIARLIEEKEVGRVVSTGRAADVVEVIFRYRDDPGAWKGNGKQARELGLRSNVDRAAKEFEKLLACYRVFFYD